MPASPTRPAFLPLLNNLQIDNARLIEEIQQGLINLTNDLGVSLPNPPASPPGEIRAAGPPSLAEAALDMERSMRRTLSTITMLAGNLRAQLLG